MAEKPLPPALKGFIDGLDRQAPAVMMELHTGLEKGEAEYIRLLSAFQLALAMRLVTVALGPAARDQNEVRQTALDIIEVLRERAEDLKDQKH